MIARLHLDQPPTAKKVVEVAVAGPVGRWFTRHGWSAFTLPLPFLVVIFYWNTPAPSPYTRVHEFVHVRQDERSRFFLSMWVGYLAELARRGYRRNRYEIEAFRVEEQARADGLPDWAARVDSPG
jgi:hypothetical protein